MVYISSVKYRVSRGWAGRLQSHPEYRLGLIGVVARGEVDISATGIYTRMNRFDEFDFYHQSWVFE